MECGLTFSINSAVSKVSSSVSYSSGFVVILYSRSGAIKTCSGSREGAMHTRTHTHAHTLTEGPWAAPSTHCFRRTHQDISYASLLCEADNSPMVLCVNTAVSARFRSV